MVRFSFLLTIFILSVSVTGCKSKSNNPVVFTPNTPLYNIDFESPTHTVGLAPATGASDAPRNTVSSANVGTPLITANFGAVNSQAVQFDSSDNEGDLIRMNLNDLPSSMLYCFEADILVNSIDQFIYPFAIYFDTPEVRSISFRSDGNIYPFVPSLSGSSTGSYSFDVAINIKVEINLTLDQWDIYTNNTLMHSGGFGSASAIDAVRIATPTIANPGSVIASVDNIRISSKACQL